MKIKLGIATISSQKHNNTNNENKLQNKKPVKQVMK